VQAANAALSRLQVKVAVGSVSLNEKLALVEDVSARGCAVIVGTGGGVASTVNAASVTKSVASFCSITFHAPSLPGAKFGHGFTS
jgi:hypothetical protein